MNKQCFNKVYKSWILMATLWMSFFVLLFGIGTAKADLLVTPMRVVLEGRDRSAVVTIVNVSNKTHTYRMEWKLFRMGDDGQYHDIPDDDNSDFAIRARQTTKMVRFSPRQVVIEPGQKQRIRLSFRRPAELEEGEYRAHLSFSKLPEIPKPSSENIQGAKMVLYVQLSFTIPIIVRNGGDVSASINEISLTPPSKDVKNKMSLNISLNREGENTAFGRLKAFWQPKSGGKEKQIGLLNNVSIYPEVKERTMRMPLDVDYVGAGSVRILYEGDGEYKGSIWDEKVFNVTQ